MASIDATVVGIALPAIGRDFHTGLAALQWVVTAYTLTLAGLLLVAGSMGDRYGRKKIFLIGVVWFALASILCLAAPNAGVLIAARAIQGIGAALLTPGSLAIIEASFKPSDRMKAIGAWSGLGGVAVAIGPFLGYKVMTDAGFTFDTQLGFEHVSVQADSQSSTAMEKTMIVLLNLNIGWSF